MSKRKAKTLEVLAIEEETALMRELRIELEDQVKLNDMLANILQRLSTILKGPELPDHKHSWHDLPEAAQWLHDHADRLCIECRAWRTWNDREPFDPDKGIDEIENARAAVDKANPRVEVTVARADVGGGE